MSAKSPEQVRQEFRQRGVPLAQWAREKGWRPADVYLVMGGKIKGYYGKSHDIAVALGLKEAA